MCGGPVTPTKSDKQRERDYMAEDDHRTLTRAEEIRADTARMSGVRRHQRKSMAALRNVGRAIGRGVKR